MKSEVAAIHYSLAFLASLFLFEPKAVDGKTNFYPQIAAERQSEELRIAINKSYDHRIPRILGEHLVKISDREFIDSIELLEANAAKFSPWSLYQFADRLLAHDNEKALFWWQVGKIRILYHLLKCKDRSAGSVVTKLDSKFAKSARAQPDYSTPTPKIFYPIALKAIDWDETQPMTFYPVLKLCASGIKGIQHSLNQSGNDELQLQTHKDPNLGAGKQYVLPKLTINPNDRYEWIHPEADKPDFGKFVTKFRERRRNQMERRYQKALDKIDN